MDQETSEDLREWIQDSELFSFIHQTGQITMTRDIMAMGTPSLHALDIDKVAEFFLHMNDPALLIDDEDLVASVFECDFWTNENSERASEILTFLNTVTIREYYLPLRAFVLRNKSVDALIDFIQAGEFDPAVDLLILKDKLKGITEHCEFSSLPEQMKNVFVDSARELKEAQVKYIACTPIWLRDSIMKKQKKKQEPPKKQPEPLKQEIEINKPDLEDIDEESDAAAIMSRTEFDDWTTIKHKANAASLLCSTLPVLLIIFLF